MNVWKAFEEKNPKLAKWVREGGLFVIVSNLITVLQYLEKHSSGISWDTIRHMEDLRILWHI